MTAQGALEEPNAACRRRTRNFLDSLGHLADKQQLMKKAKVALIAMLCGAGSILPTFAGPEPMPDYSKGKEQIVEQKAPPECDWYVSIGGGADFDYGTTDFNRRRDVGSDSGLALIRVASHSFNDVYDTNFYHIQGEVGYAVSPHVELFGTFNYETANSRTTTGSSAGIFIFEVGLRSEWSDYTSYGGQLGIRYFFLSRQARFRPYISLAGGATRVEPINLKTMATNNAGPISTGDVIFEGDFYGSSTVATGTALAGIEVGITRCFAIGADAGVRYESKLAEDDSDLSRFRFGPFFFSDLHKINDNAGDRLYCPVTLYAKIRF
jgi:hypothetical protein